MSTTTRKCSNCGEWYDARSSSCYLCGGEDREVNIALKKAVETTRLNSALSAQMGYASAERSAEQAFHAARQNGSTEAYTRVRPRLPGYRDLVETIKEGLEERPHVAEFFGPPAE